MTKYCHGWGGFNLDISCFCVKDIFALNFLSLLFSCLLWLPSLVFTWVLLACPRSCISVFYVCSPHCLPVVLYAAASFPWVTPCGILASFFLNHSCSYGTFSLCPYWCICLVGLLFWFWPLHASPSVSLLFLSIIKSLNCIKLCLQYLHLVHHFLVICKSVTKHHHVILGCSSYFLLMS